MELKEKKQKAVRRLKIISGQVQGLITLLENNADCKDIFPQIKAIKNAFSGFSSQILMGMMEECLFDSENEEYTRKKEELEEVLKYFSKL